MQFQENFNKTCEFPNYFDSFSEGNKRIEEAIQKFNREYEMFKKEHGLENLYFSRVCHVRCPDGWTTEVFYILTDLYLTYLEANDMLPEGAINEGYIFKEQYYYNTPKEWLFRDAMFTALDAQDQGVHKNGYTTYTSSMFESVTERVRLSNPSNGLPGMIIDRIPMAYNDLIENKQALGTALPENGKEDYIMKRIKYFNELDKLLDDIGSPDYRSSSEFQCEKCGDLPVSLCVHWGEGKAWLEPNRYFTAEDDSLANQVMNCIIEFGIRKCTDDDEYNNLFKSIGEDVFSIAVLTKSKNESMDMLSPLNTNSDIENDVI